MKTCNTCKLEKNLAEFNKRKNRKGGLRYTCKVCAAKYDAKYYLENKEKRSKQCAKWYQKNKEKIAKTGAKYKKDHPEKCRASDRRRRARKLQVKENYTRLDEIFTRNIFSNRCYNCQTTEELVIDHHYPLSRGHKLERDNAVVLCKSCNSSKHNKLPENFYTKEKLEKLEEHFLSWGWEDLTKIP